LSSQDSGAARRCRFTPPPWEGLSHLIGACATSTSTAAADRQRSRCSGMSSARCRCDARRTGWLGVRLNRTCLLCVLVVESKTTTAPR
jgi:hypothetical protein